MPRKHTAADVLIVDEDIRQILEAIGTNCLMFNRQGYVQIYKFRTVHLFVWRYKVGPVSKGKVIDHINKDKWDCRLENLREVTHSQNLFNKNRRSDNKSGYPGVCKFKVRGEWTGKWQAYIKKDGKQTALGMHDSFRSAVDARRKAEMEIYGEHPLPYPNLELIEKYDT